MRVTFFNQFYLPDLSPTAHLCASLAEHRAALGDKVTVIAGRGGYVAPAQPAHDGAVRVIRIWTAQLGSSSVPRRFLDWATFYIGAMLRAILLPRQDVIVCLTTPPYIALAGVIQKILHPRTKLLLWNMDCYPEAVERTSLLKPGGIASRIMRRLNRAIFQRLDHLICLDSAMQQLLMSQYAPAGQSLPCSIIPNWEREALFPRESLAARWNNPLADSLRGKFVILYLGNAGFGHEFATVVEAADRLQDEPICFLFVGGGAMRDWIAQQARSRGLSNILLHDYVAKEQTPAVMALADCALITLENYAAGVMSPSKVHANLAMGLPILYVGPKGTNVDEAIEQFDCGVSLRPGDSQGMLEFIQRLRNDPAQHQALRHRARHAFEEAYCDRQALSRFDAVFTGLFANRTESIGAAMISSL